MNPREAICKALCESGRFETGAGTCAIICMQGLGDVRAGPHGCPRRNEVHAKLAERIDIELGKVP